jgi:hypothetical protein
MSDYIRRRRLQCSWDTTQSTTLVKISDWFVHVMQTAAIKHQLMMLCASIDIHNLSCHAMHKLNNMVPTCAVMSCNAETQQYGVYTVDVKRNTYGSYKWSVTRAVWGTGTSQELSENHSCGEFPGDYFTWRKWGISEQQEWFSPRLALE